MLFVSYLICTQWWLLRSFKFTFNDLFCSKLWIMNELLMNTYNTYIYYSMNCMNAFTWILFWAFQNCFGCLIFRSEEGQWSVPWPWCLSDHQFVISWRICWRAVIGKLLVSKVEVWCKCIQYLCDAVIDESQALFIALVRLRCNLNGIISNEYSAAGMWNFVCHSLACD